MTICRKSALQKNGRRFTNRFVRRRPFFILLYFGFLILVLQDDLFCTFFGRGKLKIMHRNIIIPYNIHYFIVKLMAERIGLQPDDIRVTDEVGIGQHIAVNKADITGQHGFNRAGPGIVAAEYHREFADRLGVFDSCFYRGFKIDLLAEYDFHVVCKLPPFL